MRLDSFDTYPSGMKDYLSAYGWHFSKKMCKAACDAMYRKEGDRKVKSATYSREDVDALLAKHNVIIDDKSSYDYVYVANMCMADFMGRSIIDNYHMALYIKDVIDDPDAYEGMVFTRYFADCIGSGKPIIWEDMM